jgi:tRNA_anti-like
LNCWIVVTFVIWKKPFGLPNKLGGHNGANNLLFMKKLLPILLLLLILVGAFLFFRGNRPSGSSATVWEQDTEAEVDAVTLFNSFVQDEAGANEKYLNKIIEVSGEVSTVSTGPGSTSVVLRTNDPVYGVRCRLERQPGSDHKRYTVGQNISFKCVCSGYVQDVEMVQCVEK